MRNKLKLDNLCTSKPSGGEYTSKDYTKALRDDLSDRSHQVSDTDIIHISMSFCFVFQWCILILSYLTMVRRVRKIMHFWNEVFKYGNLKFSILSVLTCICIVNNFE